MANLDETTAKPIVFKARGLEADTRLQVFDTVFHFLGSPDKVAGSNTEGFKYDWVTKIEDDGNDWQVVCAGPNTGDLKLFECKRSNDETIVQKNAFHNILKAMHKALFKDSLIYCLGCFSSTSFGKLTDKKLKRLAQSHYHKLRSDIFEELYTILYSLCQEGVRGDNSFAANDAYSDLTSAWFKRGIALEAQNMDHGHEVYLPRLFHGMLEDERLHEPFILEKLDYVLRKDLTIGLGISEEAGKGNYEDYFLLTTIGDDEDYPWDATVDDW